MHSLLRRLLVSVLCGVLLAVVGAQAKEKPGDDIAHIREELGVNAFTAPSIEHVFDELTALRPFPFEKVWRDLPAATSGDRSLLALRTGQVIADGFLAVAGEKKSRIEPVGRVLLKLTKGLGVGDHVTRHARSILELAARGHWVELRSELIRTQAEAEAGLMALKDEEIAHLVSLGGWLRGLEITSVIVLEDFRPESTRRLVQPALLAYYLDRLDTLNPVLKKTPVIEKIERTLRVFAKLTLDKGEGLLDEKDTKQIRDLAAEANRAIAGATE